MSIPGSANPLLFASVAAEAAGYQIDRSLRFNSSDSAYLNRTPSSAGNRRTFTWSGWVKRSGLGAQSDFYSASTSSDYLRVGGFNSSDKLELRSDGAVVHVVTDQVFRDVSAWYHIVIAVDTTQSTSSNRVKFYVNGLQITDFSTSSYPSQNRQEAVNDTGEHRVGAFKDKSLATVYYPFNGYLADVHFIDGQALDPTSFGEYDDNNNWNPKAYDGTYGTNGFHLDFSDNTSTTTIAEDSSGNNNDWTANNLSVASGAGNDSLIDTPTNYEAASGNGGNYATLNPLNKHTSSDTFSNGNLDFTTSSGGGLCESTIAMSSGKYYFEAVFSGGQGTAQLAGIRKPGARNYNDSYIYVGTGNKYTDGGSGTSYGATLSNGDVIGTAFDADNGTLTFYKNGVSQGTAFTGISGTYSFFVGSFGSSPTFVTNFGQRPFSISSVPTGYKSLCTTNLPDPTIADGSTVFDVRSGLTAQFTISDLNFAADLVVAKSTSNSEYWIVADVVRSFIGGLRFNDTNAESSGNAITSVGATGYQSDSNWFSTGRTYVTYNWDAGSSTVSNTDGSVTSSVRANPSAGFSIVKYSLSGNSAQTIGHGLNSSLGLLITKATGSTNGWAIWHSSFSDTQGIAFTTGAVGTQTWWDQSNMTSSVFAHTAGTTSPSGADVIAYCFAPVDGYSSFGSYVGNGSSDGTFVYTGFRVAWLMTKRTDTSENWEVRDSTRNPHNRTNLTLFPHSTSAEDSGSVDFDLLSNGFKLRNTNGSTNASGGTYIYIAFAENPFSTARAR